MPAACIQNIEVTCGEVDVETALEIEIGEDSASGHLELGPRRVRELFLNNSLF